ncbi:MAG: histidinol-phosphate transaminase [Verrucomicrobiota bacterium]
MMNKVNQKWLQSQLAQIQPYEPGRPIEEVARELGLNPVDIHKMASNENPLGPAPAALEAMKKYASEMYLYPDGGAYHLRQRLAELYDVPSDWLVLGNGSNEVLEFIGHCYFAPGRSIVVSAHAFVIYKLIAAMFDTEVIEVPATDNYGHDLDAMADAVRPDTCAVFVCNPNNPTGTMVGADDVARLLEKVPNDVLIVFDEAYAEIALAEMPETKRIIEQNENTVMLRTFSKAYGLAGLRIGYGLACEEISAVLEKARQPFNVNRMAQKAALAALDDKSFIERSRELFWEGREVLVAMCEELGLEYVPTEANFILIKVGEGAKITDIFLRDGVIVRPMAGYGLPEFVRVSFGTAEQNQKVVDEFRKVFAK